MHLPYSMKLLKCTLSSVAPQNLNMLARSVDLCHKTVVLTLLIEENFINPKAPIFVFKKTS